MDFNLEIQNMNTIHLSCLKDHLWFYVNQVAITFILFDK